ncbi:endonuclease domain-containing protein [Vineibacter terrae]|uniref:endonuclease domain-containing protein n=1 Tax=Vineibacter terrae TaxID=2586908 RepID=UPI002E33C345|nr:DUF559 domain-containing protein [Vineibacter terrae]HEX2891846.1 DUF559 domain-containing protein [Vineibacter terrae]
MILRHRHLERARYLRREATPAERDLWKRLRFRQVSNAKFRRQRPIGRYIVDFVCLEAKLIVEIDGSQHADRVSCDEERTRFLEAIGFRVMHFWNGELLTQPHQVMEQIFTAVSERLRQQRD